MMNYAGETFTGALFDGTLDAEWWVYTPPSSDSPSSALPSAVPTFNEGPVQTCAIGSAVPLCYNGGKCTNGTICDCSNVANYRLFTYFYYL
jgi:hypothetical protein